MNKKIKNKLAFYCATDSNMIAYTKSLFKSVSNLYDDEEFDFFIIINDTVKEKFIDKKNVYFINIENYFDSLELSYLKSVKLFDRISSLTYSRLFISKIIKNNYYDSIIYIDVDGILINKIPDNLFSKNNIAFFPENTSEKLTQSYNWIINNVKNDEIKNNVSNLFINKKYFQGGLIIINDIYKYSKLEEKSLEYLKLTNDIIDDQNLMNHFNSSLIDVVNMPEANYRPDLSIDVNDDKVIYLHFAGDNKPLDENFDPKNYQLFLDKIKEFI